MLYIGLKYLHVGTVILSGTLFLWRGTLMLSGSALLQHAFVRVFPHVNDAVLLASAIALSIHLHQYPFDQHWLTVKLGALIVYIILGTVALKRGRTRLIRSLAFLAAITVFLFMVSVATTHHPAGIFKPLT